MDSPLPVLDLFDFAYIGTPPWDIGRPQAAFVGLADQGLVHGRVLDAGCGTGELALDLARRGHDVVGLDASHIAIARAQRKASERGVAATFVVGNVLNLPPPPQLFDTVVDCGLFHFFPRPLQRRYVESLARAVSPGGLVHLLCFSDKETAAIGPWRVSRPEIELAFHAGWRVHEVREARFESRGQPSGARAWLATVVRLPQTTWLH